MAEDRIAPIAPAGLTGENGQAAAELAELRTLLVGPEQRRLDDLARRLDALGLTAEELAGLLPEAIALRAGRDRQLARALASTVERALHESVRRNPRDIATAIFPVLGPAIRKAIAEAMAGLVRSINSAVEHSLSIRGLKWRVESWRTGVPYPQIVIRHALVYRVEQVFLIHSETGLPLAHVALPTLEIGDADLISGMLTAIQDFVRDSFRAEAGGTLRTFSVGELTVLVEPGPQAILAAVVRGQAPDSLLRKLQDSLETVHLQFAGELAGFTGDPAPFEGVRQLLKECLETVLRSGDGARRPRRTWLAWGVPLALFAIVMAGLAIRSERRWQRALTRLRAEAGIVLTLADRDWGRRRWRLRGLKDPLAADPRALLLGLGIDSTAIDARFEPYLSLDQALVLERIRRGLAIPPQVSAVLRDDTLRLSGSAPIGWIARVAALSMAPVGLQGVDLSSLEPALPPALSQLERDLEARRVLFEVGSATLSAAAATELAFVAAGFRRLLEAAAAPSPGIRLELELIGRTDPTGTDAANQALSQWRVDAVRRRLLTAGVPGQTLRGTAAATSNPLPGPDAEQRARLNRSVSFAVRFGLDRRDDQGGAR